MDKSELLLKLKGLSELAAANGNTLTTDEIRSFLDELKPDEDQLKAVYQYLSESHVTIRGYSAPGELTAEEIPYTEEEQTFLAQYEEELKEIRVTDELSVEAFLPEVLEEAKKLHGKGVLVQDLVQEGSMGLVLGMASLTGNETKEEAKKMMMRSAVDSMNALLDEDLQDRNIGENIADRLNKLSDSIRELNEELERQVSVEELSAFLDMPVEEIQDLLRLAGDDVEMAESGSESTDDAVETADEDDAENDGLQISIAPKGTGFMLPRVEEE